MSLATSFFHDANFLDVLYIVAFALFIYGLSGLTGPRTAVRGNRIAAVGMAIAVVATLLNPGEGNWGLIVLGVALGAAVGIPAARNVFTALSRCWIASACVRTVNPRPPTRYSFTWTTRTAAEDCLAMAVAKLTAASLEAESSMASKILVNMIALVLCRLVLRRHSFVSIMLTPR